MVQRPLWASTSTKNPAYPDTLYVDQLIGPDTVNTLPDATIDAFNDHGTLERTIDDGVAHAELVWRELAEVGVDMEDVAAKLERDGVASFSKSFDDLLVALAEKAETLQLVTSADPADELIASLLADLPAGADRRYSQQLLQAAIDVVRQRPQTLDLKIAAAALEEMGDAFAMFVSSRGVPKVTIFGSARTKARRPALRRCPRRCAPLGGAGLDGDHRCRPGNHAGGHGGRRARELDRCVDSASVRAGRQLGDRRRRRSSSA